MLARGVCTCCSSFYALLLIGVCTCYLSLYALLHCLSYASLNVHIVPVAYHCMHCCIAYHMHCCMYILYLLLIIVCVVALLIIYMYIVVCTRCPCFLSLYSLLVCSKH